MLSIHPDQIVLRLMNSVTVGFFFTQYVFMITTGEYILWKNLRLCRSPKSEISLVKSYYKALWSLSLLGLLN